jgi:hypothetical protein
MRNKLVSLLAALSLIIGATAQAATSATITITYLPYTITTAGTYVLKSNLQYPGSTPGPNRTPAINIAGPFTGPVVLDLKGFTISGPGGYQGFAYGIGVSGNNPSVTVQNGTLNGFDYALNAASTSNLTVKNVTFARNGVSIQFVNVDSSTVKNCDFVGPAADFTSGIIDRYSSKNNSYSGITFTAIDFPFQATNSEEGHPMVFDLQPPPVKTVAVNP